MKTGHKNMLKIFTSFFLILFLFTGCKESIVDPGSAEPTTDQEALLKLAEEDSSVSSFEPSFNEEEAMAFLNININTGSNGGIFPLRVGHQIRLVQRNMNVTFNGDTAYGELTLTFEGTLLVAAAFDTGATVPDTLIKKPFTTIVTRNVIFVKVGNSNRPLRNWRIAAVSLPEGGTLNSNIDIKKLTIHLPNGEVMVITDPNEFYLNRGFHWWRDLPVIPQRDSVKVDVELASAYEETDFVTLTFGANLNGLNRAKKRFELISSVPDGNGYTKVYSQTFVTHPHRGFFHAVINAFPSQVIFDSEAAVEHEMWGVPYFVR